MPRMRNAGYSLFLILILFFTAVSPFAHSAASLVIPTQNLTDFRIPSSYKNKTQIFNFKNAAGEDVQILTSYVDVSIHDLPKVFESIPKDSKKSILFSYPEASVEPIMQENPESFLRAKKTLFMPLAAKKLLKDSLLHVKNSISQDRMGLFFVTVNTAYDSFLWIHADSLSIEQRSAMVLFNVVLAASFGLDKDLWAKTTQPLENRIQTFLEKLSTGHQRGKLVAASFLSNLTFSIAIQTARVAILSYPDLVTAFSSTHFWGTSLVMGSLLTLSSFGWSEQLADVDQARNPMAKYFLRRFMELRTITMGQMAPSSKLLQPDVYGIAPIATTLIHGSIGIWMMLKSSKIVEWIESNKLLQSAYKSHRQLDLWLRFKYEEVRSAASSCKLLFEPQRR